MDRTRVAVALVAALPAAGLALLVAFTEVPHFVDPCYRWGDPSRSVQLPVDGDCRGITSTPQTKGEAVRVLLLIHGGILLGAIVGAVGVWKNHLLARLSGAGVLVVESVPLLFGFSWVFTLLSALFFYAAPILVRPPRAAGASKTTD